MGVLRPSAPRRCGADHRQPAREGRQADDPSSDHRREQREEGGEMMFRGKKVAGIALAAASITALAACSSGGSGGGGNNNNGGSSVVKVPGAIGSVPVAASGGTKKAGTITWALSPGATPNWIFPVIP